MKYILLLLTLPVLASSPKPPPVPNNTPENKVKALTPNKIFTFPKKLKKYKQIPKAFTEDEHKKILEMITDK